RIQNNLTDRVLQLYYPFSLPERLKADNTLYYPFSLSERLKADNTGKISSSWNPPKTSSRNFGIPMVLFYFLKVIREQTTLRLRWDPISFRIDPRMWSSSLSNVVYSETTLYTLEVLEGLVLKILGAVTLTVCTTFDSPVKGAEFEVTGLDKAFDSRIMGGTLDFGRGVTEYSFDLLEEEGVFQILIALKSQGFRIFIGNFTYKCNFMILEDTTSIIDHHLGEVVFRKPFTRNTGLVYDQEEGTVTFEKDDEKITFKMPHKMEASNHIDFKNLNTNSIPPFVLRSNDDRGKTYYSDSLTLGLEYREDESISKEIRHLMKLEREAKRHKGEVTKSQGFRSFIGNFTYKCNFMILEDTTSIIDHHLGELVFRKPFIRNTGLVYDQEEGTVTFEKDDEKITFKMPHKMEASNHIDFKNLNTDSIPPFVLRSNDDCGKTYYSDSLTLGLEYRQDESISKEIRHLMKLEREAKRHKGEVT
nr:protein kinase-like domain, concanavalin A-like lectin/glucanase domain protein [Tanacetum cinerariifolium]